MISLVFQHQTDEHILQAGYEVSLRIMVCR